VVRTVLLPPHFCAKSDGSDGTTRGIHADVHVSRLAGGRRFTNDGQVGLGNAALAPQVTKQVIDLYLRPLLMGQDPWDVERLWQHSIAKTMAFGRKGIGMVAISALDIAFVGPARQVRQTARVSHTRRPDQNTHSGLRIAPLQHGTE